MGSRVGRRLVGHGDSDDLAADLDELVDLGDQHAGNTAEAKTTHRK